MEPGCNRQCEQKDPLEEMRQMFHFQCDKNDSLKKEIERLVAEKNAIIAEKDAVISRLSISLEKITASLGGRV